MVLIKKLDISIEKNTRAISEKLSKNLKIGDTIHLYGEVGVGKTTFIKYIINFLQSENNEEITEVPSPTFNIINEYNINSLRILHYDLYRVKNLNDLQNIGLKNQEEDCISFIEWPEIISNKPKKIIELYFSYENDFKNRYLEIFSENRKQIVNESK